MRSNWAKPPGRLSPDRGPHQLRLTLGLSLRARSVERGEFDRRSFTVKWELDPEAEIRLIEIRRASFHSRHLRDGLRTFGER
jgi:hypothetical protein